MDETINLELTSEQAAQLSELIEEHLKEMRATNEVMALRQVELEALRAETKAIIAQLQERAERGWNVEVDH